MKAKITSLAVAVAFGILAVVAAPGPAQASANKCAGSGPYSTCVDIKGRALHVETIKGQVTTPPGNSCVTGHSQILINGAHFGDSPIDRTYCSGGSLFQQKHTTATWTVNRDYAKGTQICAKFWKWVGGTTRYTYDGLACATIG